ncbi:hypothetical protein FB45DRAFT_1001677 [Roridomyces roridus]|uniref:Uncharacterized protein n=1 Tax=Roridomyces roridus TaxID=1738132 RepID=A0AAD7C1L4_9AGAR|nr:hypothetical protein FB45DRAFT_1001677 [Roridomyces roridus]
MCPFCGSAHHALSTSDPRPMSELRLTEAEYKEYKGHNASDTMYSRMADGKDAPVLRVVGFNDDTKAVFRACNPDGHEYVEVPWSRMDSMKWIAQRVEDKIQVALHHWYLATADGVIFRTFGELVMSYDAFRVKEQVVLTLLMPSDLEEFSGSHLKKHAWKRTEAPTPGSLTEPNSTWETYLEQRKGADTHLEEALEIYEGDDLPPIYDMIEAAVDSVLERSDLEDEAADVVYDCVVPLSVEVEDSGWGNVQSASILTRIYSPTRPAAVDVYLDYHHRTRYSSVEFFCNVYYRIQRTVSTTKLDAREPRGPRKMNGFRMLFELGLADLPPGNSWKAVDEREFGIKERDVCVIHELLFGLQEEAETKSEAEEDEDDEADTTPATKITMRNTLSLLLASVGISFYGEDLESGELCWEGIEGSERWLGKNIRRVVKAAAALGASAGEDSEDEDEELDEDEDEDGDDWDDDDNDGFPYEDGPSNCRYQ